MARAVKDVNGAIRGGFIVEHWRGISGMAHLFCVMYGFLICLAFLHVGRHVIAIDGYYKVFSSIQKYIHCLSSDSREIKEAYKYAEEVNHEAVPCYSNSPSDNLRIAQSLRETGGYGKCDNPVECIVVIRSETRDITICKHVSEFLTDGFPTAADIHVSEGMRVEKAIAEYCM